MIVMTEQDMIAKLLPGQSLSNMNVMLLSAVNHHCYLNKKTLIEKIILAINKALRR